MFSHKMKKLIIGFIGDHNAGKTTAANILKKKGFFKASINDKVLEFAGHLFSDSELNRPDRNLILNRVRRRGCDQCKEYWLNLILITVPDDKNFIVFDDLSLNEASSKNISVYHIYRPGISAIQLSEYQTIMNDGSLKDFASKIDDLYKKITGRS